MAGMSSCSSGSGTSSDNDDTDSVSSSSGVAAAALFGSSEEAYFKNKSLLQKLANLVIRKAVAEEEDENGTCTDENGDHSSDIPPGDINATLYGSAGTYGADNNSVEVVVGDFCELENGTTNFGDGPFASFSLTAEVTGICSDDTTVTITSASGIWRNTEEATPEIFGTFVIDGTTINCSLALSNEDGSMQESSSCSTEAGSDVTINSDVTCEING